MNSKRKTITDMHEFLYSVIGTGRENAQSKSMLQIKTGYNERTIRKLIEELSTNGLVVCNLQDGNGYYKPETKEDYEAVIKIESSRANALRRKVYGVKSAFNEFMRTHEESVTEH